jgi:hypothetical protein
MRVFCLDARRIVRELKGVGEETWYQMPDLNAADLATTATTTTVIPQQLEQELGIDLSDDKSFSVLMLFCAFFSVSKRPQFL